MPVVFHKAFVAGIRVFCLTKRCRTNASRSCRTPSATTIGGGARLVHAMVD